MAFEEILVVSAVPQEIAPFRAVAPRTVQCLVAGIGARAGQAVRRQLAEQRVRLVISAGFAGGLRPGLRVGDLVMASEVIEGASGLRRASTALFGLNGMASVGPFLTVQSALAQPSAKAQMGERYGAIAVDLETAAIAQAATEAGVGWIGIRSILDPMETMLSVTSRWDAVRMLAAPGRWGEFACFLKAVRTASKSLATGLKRFVDQVSLSRR